MTKKLSMKRVSEKAKSFDEKIDIFFDEGTEYESKLTFHPYFSDDKLENLARTMQEDFKNWVDLGLTIEDDDVQLLGIVNYEIVKEFTDIYTPKDPKTDFQLYRELVKSGCMKEIRDHFVEAEVFKVLDMISETMITQERLNRIQDKYMEGIQNLDLQNEELEQRVKNQKQIPEA